MTASPYKISVADSAISTLQEKLSLTRLPNELSDSGWSYGAPLNEVRRLARYWQDGFDWRTQEDELNKLPQYTCTLKVDGFKQPLDVHFVHQPSPVPEAIPLLFVHGWPGSYIEVKKLLPLLVNGGKDGKKPAFHIVAPSLPNFGFSAEVKQTGFKLGQYAETCHKLMQMLGYDKYVTQGGDWGYYITRAMGLLYPKHVLASHVNMVRASAPAISTNPFLALQHSILPYSQKEKDGLARYQWFMTEGSGYRQEQATKPQTLAYSLEDSPVGLLAWILEKLHDWTDSYPWTDDEILTWVSIYWFSTAGPGASVRIYYEATHDDSPTSRDATCRYIPEVKLGLAYFPKELSPVPRTWGRTLGPIAFESEHERGGHFAAWEVPELVADDLFKMFGKGGPCAGIVPGHKGYVSNASRL